MKKTTKFNKIIAIIMLIILFIINAQPIFAISGSGTYAGGQFASYMYTTDHPNNQYGVLIRFLINKKTGEKMTVFCAEHDVSFSTSVAYNGEYYTPTNSALKKACKIAYVGWYSKYGDYVVNGGMSNQIKKDYTYTQQYIWQALGQSNASFTNTTYQAEYEDYKREIDNIISSIEKKPSFNDSTISIQAGESKTINDEFGVFSKYESVNRSQDGITFIHNKGENTLTIFVDENANLENYNISDSTFKSWGLIREDTQDNDTMIYFEFKDGVQNQLYSMHYNDPVSLKMTLNIETFGKLELQKLNTTGDLVDGAVFNVKGNNFNQDVVVSNGKITIDKLKQGTYTITEKSAPYGYLIDTKVYNVEVKANETATKAIVNGEPTGTIQVIKKSEQGDLIKDTTFIITANEEIKNVAGTKTYYTNGQEVAKITTNSKGLAEITNLPLGKYVVEEIKASNGYLLDSTKHEVTLSYKGQTEKIVLESFEKIDTTPMGEIKVYKTNNTGDKIKGAEISLYAREDIKNVAGTKTWYKKGDLVAKTITNEQGIVTFSNLHLGHYYAKETKAPDGYLLNTKEFDAELKYKDQTTKVIYVDVNGIVNDEPTGTITIIKKDAKKGFVSQGDATLTGAVYKVYTKEDIYNKAKTKKFYSKGDIVATRTINEKGTTEDITNLPLGKYVVKEEKASLGYMLDAKEYEVNLEYKDQNTKVISNTTTSMEKVKEMGVHIFKSGIKINSGETPGLEGAEFTIKLNSEVEEAYKQGYTYAEVWNGIDENGNKVKVDSSRVAKAQIVAPSYEIIKTDSEGNAYTKNKLPYGKYIVKETKTPTDYETAVDFTFSITNDETEIEEVAKKTKHIVVNNEQLESYVKIIKKDLKTEKNVTLNSTTFEIKATKDIYDRATKKILFKKGEVISQKIGNTTYTSFTTNADSIVVPDNSFNSINDNNSEVTTPLKLPVGSYEITEIKVPDGFLKLDKSVTFEIKNIKDYDTDKDGDFIKEVIVKNEQPTGEINLIKTITLRENADTSLVKKSDLSGIEFKLLAKENIIDKADGSVIYKQGQEVKKSDLTKAGKLTITNLPLGIYEIIETKTLAGLVLNKTKYEVKLEQKDLTTKVYSEKVNISNDTTIVEFSKTDVTGDKELKGAKLSVLDSENKVIDTWTSTDKTHKIEGLKIGKQYTLKEEIAPLGYVVSNEVKFTIKDTNEIQKVNMIDKIVEISKEDVSGKEIEGAKLQVLDESENIIDEWISEKDAHKVKRLEENKTYKLHEELSVGNYVKASDIEFKVTTDKNTQKIVMIDKLVEVTKTDITNGKELEGAELEVIDADGKIVDKWTSTKEPHQVKGLEEGKTYYLKETTAPYGYEITEEIKFVVTTDKEIQKIEMNDMPILKSVRVEKIDIDTKEHIKSSKFTFGIFEDEECIRLIKEAGANEFEGTALFDNLRYGTYYIKELKAPLGYKLSNQVVKIEINDEGVFADGVSLEETDSIYSFEYYNSLLPAIQTGNETNYTLLFGIAAIATVGIIGGTILLKKKKNN